MTWGRYVPAYKPVHYNFDWRCAECYGELAKTPLGGLLILFLLLLGLLQ